MAKLKESEVSPDETIWCDRGFFPSYYGFCPSEKAWKKTLKLMKIDTALHPYPAHTSDASVQSFEKDGPAASKRLSQIVTISEKIDSDSNAIAIVGIFAHEAMHVWRHIRENMGEHSPSSEFEAYSLQFIIEQLLEAYRITRKWKPQ